MFIYIFIAATDDYVEQDKLLVFTACQSRKCVDILIVNDEVTEKTESFGISILRSVDLGNQIQLEPSSGEIHVTDDDGN